MLGIENFLTACAAAGIRWGATTSGIVSSTTPARHCALLLLNSDHYTDQNSDASSLSTESAKISHIAPHPNHPRRHSSSFPCVFGITDHVSAASKYADPATANAA